MEVKTHPSAATREVPFAEEATVATPYSKEFVRVQLLPAFVEKQIPSPAAANLVPSDEEATDLIGTVLYDAQEVPELSKNKAHFC